MAAAGALLPTVGAPFGVLAGEPQPTDRHPWLRQWVAEEGFDPAWLNRLLRPLTADERVIRLMDNQAEGQPYHRYRQIFLTENRIQRGVNRMRRHRALLARVQDHYGIPSEILLALWGLESNYGQVTGGFPVLRTLYTLAAHYPRRAEFFQDQLRAFLLLCRDEGWNPTVPLGSPAGAMGQAQMIPQTMRDHAVDFDGDGKRDIFHNTGDVLASIANFLRGHGWRPGGPYAVPLVAMAGGTDPDPGQRITPTLDEMQPWRQWAESGITVAAGGPQPGPEEPTALIMLEETTGPRYHMVFGNFRVITRWNRSRRFAMVVREMADHLRKASQQPS